MNCPICNKPMKKTAWRITSNAKEGKAQKKVRYMRNMTVLAISVKRMLSGLRQKFQSQNSPQAVPPRPAKYEHFIVDLRCLYFEKLGLCRGSQ